MTNEKEALLVGKTQDSILVLVSEEKHVHPKTLLNQTPTTILIGLNKSTNSHQQEIALRCLIPFYLAHPLDNTA